MAAFDALPNGARVGAVGQGSETTRTGTVASGFGSAAEDRTVHRIDLNEVLVDHPDATFFVRAAGDGMRDAGIDSGDALIVDRALKPAHGDIVIAAVDAEMMCRRLLISGGVMTLHADNPERADIRIDGDIVVELWGVVTSIIKQLR